MYIGTEKKSARYLSYFIFFLPYPSTSAISGEQQMGYFISWWIGKLLGRAGFEPA